MPRAVVRDLASVVAERLGPGPKRRAHCRQVDHAYDTVAVAVAIKTGFGICPSRVVGRRFGIDILQRRVHLRMVVLMVAQVLRSAVGFVCTHAGSRRPRPLERKDHQKADDDEAAHSGGV